MEWAFDMKWKLVSVPKGAKLTLTAPKDSHLPAREVETLYPLVGIAAGIIPAIRCWKARTPRAWA